MTAYGVAGGGLKNPTWLANKDTAAAGLVGEQKTGELLERLAAPGVAVLHDLSIPGARANIDHAVVSGRRVLLIDAKLWKPNVYWTFRGVTRRGFTLFPKYAESHPASHRTLIGEGFHPADKRTLPLAVNRITQHLLDRGAHSLLSTPIIAVWPSRANGSLNLTFARAPEARIMRADRLTSRMLGSRPADARTTNALKELLPR